MYGLGDYQKVTPTPQAFDEPQPITLAERLNIGDMGHTFANFKTVAGAEDCLKVFSEAAEGISPTPFIFCYGGVGNGKTHMLEAMVIRLNERGLFTRYYTWSRIISNLRRFIRRDDATSPPYDVIFGRWCQSPRLIIDDLGMGTTDTDWELSQLEGIITYRYHVKLFTTIATNKDIKDMPPRVVSRLRDKEVCTICLNKAPDYRLTKARTK